ncbi:MAG: TIGR00282 family metallophosphoesterase [Candidatus Coatesbacteria bacterium]|nr:TIGR00282 family metallophosphoesterase [Candidatus Coatesbacteria bacterium]
MRLLFIGDIIGKPGREVVANVLPKLVSEYSLDLVVANGENLAGGFGITRNLYGKLLHYGVDIVTSGNHIFDRQDASDLLEKENRILRPANYPSEVPGKGFILYQSIKKADLKKAAVVNLIGRVYMNTSECPFRIMKELLPLLQENTRIIIVDFHAEATAEKQAMGFFLDGWVSIVIGTHTHVQTADERILPKGTGFITDVGMTGPFDSVIGMRKEGSIKKFITGMPVRYKIASEDLRFNGLIAEIDDETGKCLSLSRLNFIYEGPKICLSGDKDDED